jgi:pyridoxal phosphate enzyme (YggS family)
MVAENILKIKQEIGEKVELVVVSKYRHFDEIQKAYDAGIRHFAENRVQALLERKTQLPSDIQWHIIGHLQTNKVKHIVPFVAMIQSADSLKLLQEINKQAIINNRTIDCLLQVYIASEDTKFGLSETELFDLLNNPEFQSLTNIRICGLMGMATNTENQEQIKQEFTHLKTIFNQVKKDYPSPDFKTLSMGMSSDYQIAIACGSNMIRVGSRVFE